MSKKVALLLLTFFAYTLVLVHGIMPHQHHHQTGTQAAHHAHDSHAHSHDTHHHSHDYGEPEQKEHPFSHYFHSTVQGEPHLSSSNSNLVSAPLADARNTACVAVPEAPVFTSVQGSTLYVIGFWPPPHQSHLPQRGPPAA
jgi:hypothetical protein